ncbi:SDR family NAD(P)-dependent oxidoreductase [Arsenophonus nasoniae]|uniref:SDR family NAD(P)-dependent oxidoreductase n=1 Tax=Arsenophonus nasoniae TaxID=638 RepID=UPI00387996E4
MKKILITGHASGIGDHAIRQFHNQGYEVIGLDVNINKELDKSILQIACDLTDENQVTKTFGQLPHIDYAVNCAGVSGVRKPILALTSENIIDSFRSIFMPTFYAVKQEIKLMKEKESLSKIINIASSTASMGANNMAAYSCAKAAIVNLTKVCAVENAPNILVNSISPATIDTPMIRKKYHGRLPDYSKMYLTGNCGTTGDVFSVISMLIQNNFITGQDIVIDGGYSSAFLLRL